MKKHIVWLVALLLALGAPACAQTAWIDVQGSQLAREDGTPFVIHSMTMSGEDVAAAMTLPLDNVYNDIAYLGFNAISLGFQYSLLEQDDTPYSYLEEGFACLDLHIAKAAERGLYTILNLDAPQGGFQSWGDGDALWLEAENQARVAAMWGAIAERYANNPNVLGYSLLNEPCPVASSMEEAISVWQSFAERIIAAIRARDERHILFVECCTCYNDPSTGQTQRLTNEQFEALRYGFPQIDDPHLVLQFQQYSPYAFTSQAWSDPQDTPYLVYPSDFVATLTKADGVVNTTQGDSFNVDAPYWETLQSELYKVEDPSMQYVSPAVSLWAMGESGAIWIDDMSLNEYDKNGDFVRTALHLSFNSQTDFALYAATGMAAYVYTGGQDGDGGTLYVSGVLEGGYTILESARVPVRQGYSYQLTIKMGGTGLTYSSSIGPMLSFHRGEGALAMNVEYLAYSLSPYLAYSKATNTPIFVGGYGTNWASFSHGGLAWVRDILALYESNDINRTYFLYRNDYYGLYLNDGTVNEALYELFAENAQK